MPDYFYLLAVIPLIIGAEAVSVLRKRKAFLRTADTALLGRLAPGASFPRKIVKSSFIIIALVLMIIALARPQYGTHSTLVKRRGVDIVGVIDTSKSMLARDVSPRNRLQRAKLEVSGLIERLRGDRIGLVAFAGSAFVQCPLTSDYEAAKLFLRAIEVGSIPVNGTNLGEALSTGRRMFENSKGGSRSKVIVVISDGEDHESTYEQEVKKLREMGVVIHTVGIGTNIGELIPQSNGRYLRAQGKTVMTRLRTNTLKTVSQATGGLYIHSAAGTFAFDAISEKLSQMQKSDYEERLETVYEEKFQVFLFLALLAVLASTLISSQKVFKLRPFILFFVLAFFALHASDAHGLDFFTKKLDAVEQGNAFYEQKNFDKALESYKGVQQKNATYPEVHFNQGDALYKLGNTKKARDAYLRALDTKSPALKKQSYYNIGNAFLNERAFENAVAYYRRALEVDPNFDDARFNLEIALREIEKQKNPQAQNQNTNHKDKQRKNQEKQNKEQTKDQTNQDQQKKNEQNEQNEKDKDRDKHEQRKDNDDQEQKDAEQKSHPKQDIAKNKPEHKGQGELSKAQIRDLLDSERENEKPFQLQRFMLPEFKTQSRKKGIKDW